MGGCYENTLYKDTTKVKHVYIDKQPTIGNVISGIRTIGWCPAIGLRRQRLLIDGFIVGPASPAAIGGRSEKSSSCRRRRSVGRCVASEGRVFAKN